MDEFLTILTTGGLIALCCLFILFFLLAPNNGQHKQSLFRMTALLYFIILLQALIFAGAMMFYPHLIMDWRLHTMFDLPAIPFVTFVIKEMLYPDKHVDGKIICRHIAIPMTLLAAFLVAYNLDSAATIWFFRLMNVWALVYIVVALPLAIVRIRRYNILAREIFVDVEGYSLIWLARLSGILFVLLIAYGVYCIFEMNFLTTWIYNVCASIFFVVWGLQISRMHRNDPIRIDEPEEVSEEMSKDASDGAKFVTDLENWLMADNRIRSNDLNREMVARAMGTNHITLARILREQTGMTLAQFVTDLRLREAERLLLDTRMTIEEVYCSVGYQNRSTFSRAFQERNQCSATEWRIEHSKKQI